MLAGVFAARPGDAAERIGLTAVLLTLAGILLVSLWRPVSFPGRSEMVVLPIWIWTVARAADRSRPLRAISGATAVIGAIACVLICTSPSPGGAGASTSATSSFRSETRRSARIRDFSGG